MFHRVALLLCFSACGARTTLESNEHGSAAPPVCPAPTRVEVLAALDVTAGRLVVDSQHVFVDTIRGLMRVPKCGGNAPVIVSHPVAGQYAATGLLERDDDVYFTASAPVHGGFVRRVPKSGGHGDDLAATPSDLFGLGSSGDRLVWVEKGSGSGRLWSLKVGERFPVRVLDVPIAYSYGPLLADGLGVVFYAEQGNNHGNLYDVRDGAGLTDPRAIAQEPVEIVGGISPMDLYFTFGHTADSGIAHVARGKSGGHRELVAHGPAPFGLARRGPTLYWSDCDSVMGAIQKCELSASDPLRCDRAVTIASSEGDPRFVVVDESAVYWATRSGVVKRAPL